MSGGKRWRVALAILSVLLVAGAATAIRHLGTTTQRICRSAVAPREIDILDGDFTTDGDYLRITVVPR